MKKKALIIITILIVCAAVAVTLVGCVLARPDRFVTKLLAAEKWAVTFKDSEGNITSINIIGWENLEEVILEEGISKLGGYCFNSCYNLEYIVLPSTLKEINFFGLATTGIRNIVIPKSTTTLGESILGWCKNPITVHCEAESKPEGWNDNWAKNAPEGTTIDWGYKR